MLDSFEILNGAKRGVSRVALIVEDGLGGEIIFHSFELLNKKRNSVAGAETEAAQIEASKAATVLGLQILLN